MSAHLTVAVDEGPLERTRAELAVVYWFGSDRPLQAGAGRVDWRLCGQISRLIVDGKLCGQAGEAILLQAVGGLRAPLVICLGLGERRRFDAAACEALGFDAARRATNLGAATLALPLPDPHAGDLELAERVETLVVGALRALTGSNATLRLLLVPPAAELARVGQVVSALARRQRPTAVELTLEGATRSRGEGLPHGVREPSLERPQLIK